MKPRVLISDTSCLIDLRDHDLIIPFLRLPFEFLIPDVMYENELLSFSEREKTWLVQAGLNVCNFSPEEVESTALINAKNPALSLSDCFAITLALRHQGCVLLTGDARLRREADRMTIEVHGFLWALDLIAQYEQEARACVVRCLRIVQANPGLVRLPLEAIEQLLGKLTGRA